MFLMSDTGKLLLFYTLAAVALAAILAQLRQ